MNGFNKRYFLLILLIFIAFLSISLMFNSTIIWIIFAISLAFIFVITKIFKIKRKNLNTILILMLVASIVGVGRAELVSFERDELVEKYTGNHLVSGYVIEVSSSYAYMSESVVKIDSIDGDNTDFESVLLTDFASDFALGDRFECCADIFLLDEYEDREFLSNSDNRDIALIGVVKSEDDILITGDESNISLTLAQLNSKISAKLIAILGSRNGSLASALLLGNRELIDVSALRDFKRAGVYHMLALSGLHVAILIGMLDFILKKARANTYVRIIILSVLAIFYVALTGFKLSACRAMLMLLMVYLSMIIRARGDAMTSLFVAVSTIAFVSPLSVFDLGFQLSFLSTFGVLVANVINSKLTFLNKSIGGSEFRKKAYAILTTIIKLSIVSVCVFVITLPLLMKYFAEVSLATFFTNLFMGVICEAFMVLSLMCLVFYNVFGLGSVIVYLASVSGNIIEIIVDGISSVDGVMLSLRYPNVEYLVYGLFVLSILLFAIKLNKKWLIGVPSIIFVALFCINVCLYKDARDGFVRAEYSYGDAMVLSSFDEVYVCDASNGRYGNLYEAVMLAKDNCFTEIDGVVLTHYHSYHRTSLNRLADAFVIKSVYLPMPQNEQETMVLSSIALALENTATKIYLYDSMSALELLGGELFVSDRAYSVDYSHPSVALSYSFGNSRITLLENPYFDTYLENSGDFDDYIKESDLLICGSDGREPENRFELFYLLKDGARVVFTSRETLLLSDFEAYIDKFEIYVDVEYKKYDLK